MPKINLLNMVILGLFLLNIICIKDQYGKIILFLDKYITRGTTK